jgi:transcriptional antiterminator RfaH
MQNYPFLGTESKRQAGACTALTARMKVMLRWYLIHTRPLSEAIAQTNLERQGFEVYFPRLQQSVRRNQGWRTRIGALFPRYLFLRLDAGRQALGPVRSTAGVASVVRFGAEFAVVPDGVVHELRSRADPESGLHRLDGAMRFARGSAVKIVASAFDGLEGVFERTAGRHRVVILLALLGGTTPVRVPVDLVFPGQIA